MITIQLKVHMYHFVLGQTNDIYLEIYNSYSYLHYWGKMWQHTSNNISWSVNLGSTVSRFEVNKNIFGGWAGVQRLRFSASWKMRFFCSVLKHIRLFRCVAQQCWETHISSQEKVSWLADNPMMTIFGRT
jgi:hypothetical protein